MAKQDVTVELFYSGVWNDHAATGEVLSGDASHGQDIVITRGRGDEQGGLTPSTASLTFKGWRFNPENVTSNLFGLIGRNTPIRITVGTDVRFVGEVASWTPRQSLGGDTQQPDRWVEVEAAGILRRLGQGQDPLQSAPRRLVDQSLTNLVGYWSMGGNRTGNSILSDVGVGGQMRISTGNASFGINELAPWIGDGSTIEGATSVSFGARARSSIRAESTTIAFDHMHRYETASLDANSGHTVQLFSNADDSYPGFTATLDVINTGTQSSPAWEIRLTISTDSTLIVDGPNDSDANADYDFAVDGAPHHVRVEVTVDGGTGDLTYTVSGDGGSSILSSSRSGTALTSLIISRLSVESHTLAGRDIVLGQVAIWKDSPPDTSAAYSGHVGEHAGDRFVRLAGEEDITITVVGTAADTQPMGPQFVDTLLAQFAEIEATDDGLIFDTRTAVGLTMKTGRDRYNQTAVLELDYAAAEVAPPLEPVIDDQQTRNDITAARRAGSSARAVDDDSVTTVGRYATQIDVNPMSDVDLGNHAGWHLHLGTVGGIRFPQVTVDLDATPDLATAASAVDVGDRITVDNLPADLTPDLASLLVLGYTETIGTHRRRITFNCRPEQAFHIAMLESATPESPTVRAEYGWDDSTADDGDAIAVAGDVIEVSGAQYDSDFAHGIFAAEMADNTEYVRIANSGTATHSFSAMVNVVSLGVSGSARLITLATATNAIIASIRVRSDSTIDLADSGGTQQDVSATTITTGQYLRLDGQFDQTVQATPTITVRIFTTPTGTVPDETLAFTASGVGAAQARWQLGALSGTAGYSARHDTFRVADGLVWLGPRVSDGSIVGSDSAVTAEVLDATETGVDINCGAGADWGFEENFDIVIGGERMTVTAVAAMAGTFPNRTTTLTVVRSVNGVVKTHATSADVRLFDLRYIGL